MGGLCPVEKEPEQEERLQPQKQTIQQQIESVDVVKMKLKQARERIKTFISHKEKDVAQLKAQIQQKYKQTGSKKQLVPLLKAKKDLNNMIEQGNVRLTLVNDKLAQVEMQQVSKEVLLPAPRPSTCSKTPTSTLRRSKITWKTRIGRMC